MIISSVPDNKLTGEDDLCSYLNNGADVEIFCSEWVGDVINLIPCIKLKRYFWELLYNN